MSPITTHILDVAAGRPAAGVAIELEKSQDGDWVVIGRGFTDDDGRCGTLMNTALATGTYRIGFDTGGYFERRSERTFYPEVKIVFEVAAADEHYHVPLLLSPFGYSTYRGS